MYKEMLPAPCLIPDTETNHHILAEELRQLRGAIASATPAMEVEPATFVRFMEQKK